MLQHRPVDLLQQIRADLDDEIGPDTEDVAVVGGVMDLAEGQAIAHGGNTRLLTVRDDVRGVKERTVSQGAHRASRVVGAQHGGPEDRLVEALPRLAQNVTAQVLGDRCVTVDQAPRDVRVDDELLLLGSSQSR